MRRNECFSTPSYISPLLRLQQKSIFTPRVILRSAASKQTIHMNGFCLPGPLHQLDHRLCRQAESNPAISSPIGNIWLKAASSRLIRCISTPRSTHHPRMDQQTSLGRPRSPPPLPRASCSCINSGNQSATPSAATTITITHPTLSLLVLGGRRGLSWGRWVTGLPLCCSRRAGARRTG